MEYTLTRIQNFDEAVKVLELLDNTIKFFWISCLPLSDSTKGRLILHFGL